MYYFSACVPFQKTFEIVSRVDKTIVMIGMFVYID